MGEGSGVPGELGATVGLCEAGGLIGVLCVLGALGGILGFNCVSDGGVDTTGLAASKVWSADPESGWSDISRWAKVWKQIRSPTPMLV